jgi:hypothetical protein
MTFIASFLAAMRLSVGRLLSILDRLATLKKSFAAGSTTTTQKNLFIIVEKKVQV